MRRYSEPGDVTQEADYFSKIQHKHSYKLGIIKTTTNGVDATGQDSEGSIRVTVNRPILRFSDVYPPSPVIQKSRRNEPEGRKGLREKIKNWSSVNSVTSLHFPKENLSTVATFKKECRRIGKNYCNCHALRKFLLITFPFVSWLRRYKLKEWLASDIVSGFTAAIYQVPQGLGNALLARVPPVIGLYTSFFPPLVYCFLGTSMQTSVGTFTVLSLMMGNVIKNYAHVETITVANSTFNVVTNIKGPIDEINAPTPLQVATAVAFLSGIVQLIVYVLRLGKLGVLISPALANGFSAGCAVQTSVSQFKSMFGLKFEDYGGTFSVINTLIAFFDNIRYLHVPTSVLSMSVVILIVLGKDALGPIFQKKARFPLPVDLIVVVMATLTSYYMELNDNYQVPIIGDIPNKLPNPIMPDFAIFKMVMADSIAIGLVAFTSTFSMATMYAKKYDHKVDANQELLALGLSNIVGGVFSSIPASGSLARSSVLESVGCKTQLTGMISCVIMIFFIYFVGPLMAPLPKCVLSASIAIAVKNYFSTIKEIFVLWPVSRADSIVWAVTFFAVVCLDVSYGLIAGVITALFSITWRMRGYRGSILKEHENSGIYLTHSKKLKTTISSDFGEIIIFRFASPLFFATTGHFERDVQILVSQHRRFHDDLVPVYLVIDCSSMCFIDHNGAEILTHVIKDCREENMEVLIAAAPDKTLKTLDRSGLLEQIGYSKIFPSIQDAVKAAKLNQEMATPKELIARL